MWERNDETIVETLRVRGARQDEPALRMRLGHALNALDLKPTSLAPAAILMIRSIEDPLPGKLDLQSALVDTQWGRALRTKMDEIHHSAVRPGNGRIFGDCNAVLFADRSEMLACFSRDIATGVVWRRWWWRNLLARLPGGVGPSKAMATALGQAIESLPGVIDHLHQWRESESVISILTDNDVRMFIESLMRHLDLRILTTCLNRVLAPREGPKWNLNPRTAGSELNDALNAQLTHDVKDSRGLGATESGPEWKTRTAYDSKTQNPESASHKVLPDELAEISRMSIPPAHRILLTLGVLLTRRPWQLKSPDMPRMLNALAGVAPGFTHPTMDSVRDVDNHSLKQIQSGLKQSDMYGEERSDREAPADKPLTDHNYSKKEVSKNPRSSLQDKAKKRVDAKKGTSPFISVLYTDDNSATNAANNDAKADRAVVNSIDDNAEALKTTRGELEIDTVYGGVLYLINLMNSLGLPDCFESDWKLASRVGPWALLELLGRGLLETAGIDCGDDALWRLLAKLDGRDPAVSPAAMMSDAKAYRLPVGWFAQLAEYDRPKYFRWAAAGGRLRVWSQSPYLLVDAQCPAKNAGKCAELELSRFVAGSRMLLKRAAFSSAPLGLCRNKHLPVVERFIRYVIPYIQCRLGQALAAQRESRPMEIADLLHCRARIFLTSSHVDLVTDIDNISISARVAGLDKDPGWLPQFGKVVLFHYE